MSRESIAKALKRLREQSNLTADQVGLLVGKSGKTVNAWENNRGQPDAEILMQLCDIYNVDDILAEFRDDIRAIDTNAFTTEEKEHIKKYRLLDQHGQKAVDSVLNIEYERCSNSGGNNNLVEIPYVARSETGERGTLVKTQEEVDEFVKNLNPGISGRF